MIILAIILFHANVTLPTAIFFSVLVLSFLAANYGFPDSVAGIHAPFVMMYLIILCVGGAMVFHFFFRRAG